MLNNLFKNHHSFLIYSNINNNIHSCDDIALKIIKNLMCKINFSDITKYCSFCSNCLYIKNNYHPNVFIYKNINSIKSIKSIINNIYLYPYKDNLKKIIFISNINNLSYQASISLLKQIENPPQNIIFIMTCNKLSLIPITLLSRCIKYNIYSCNNDLKSIFYKKIIDYIYNNNIYNFINYINKDNLLEFIDNLYIIILKYIKYTYDIVLYEKYEKVLFEKIKIKNLPICKFFKFINELILFRKYIYINNYKYYYLVIIYIINNLTKII